MREIEKERLSPMDVCTDFAETREKFADDNQFIKPRHPKPSGDNPNQKYRERCQPRPPTAPRTVGPAVLATPKSVGEGGSAASHLENQNAGKQKSINDRAFDQHSGRQQTKQHPTILRSTRLPVSYVSLD